MANTTPCPRCEGVWGEDTTCYLCCDPYGEARPRESVKAVTLTIYVDSTEPSVEELAREVWETEGVLHLAESEGTA